MSIGSDFWKPGRVMTGLDGRLVLSSDGEALLADNRFPPIGRLSVAQYARRWNTDGSSDDGWRTDPPPGPPSNGPGKVRWHGLSENARISASKYTIDAHSEMTPFGIGTVFSPSTVKAFRFVVSYQSQFDFAPPLTYPVATLWLGAADATAPAGFTDPWTGAGWAPLTTLILDDAPHDVPFSLEPDTTQFWLGWSITAPDPVNAAQGLVVGDIDDMLIEFNPAKPD